MPVEARPHPTLPPAKVIDNAGHQHGVLALGHHAHQGFGAAFADQHAARAGQALLSGGGLKVGQVLGATDKLGSDVLDRPIHYQQVLATLYHSLGLGEDPSISDVTGRRLPILDPGIRPIGELIA